jgi:hypothetical protein
VAEETAEFKDSMAELEHYCHEEPEANKTPKALEIEKLEKMVEHYEATRRTGYELYCYLRDHLIALRKETKKKEETR